MTMTHQTCVTAQHNIIFSGIVCTLDSVFFPLRVYLWDNIQSGWGSFNFPTSLDEVPMSSSKGTVSPVTRHARGKRHKQWVLGGTS